MDVIKQPSAKKAPINKIKVILALIFIAVISIWAASTKGSLALDREELLIGIVQHGNLEITITGIGSLTSNKQQLITAFSPGTVKEVMLKPGAAVTENDIIIQLENPELEQQLNNAKQALIQEKANLRQLDLTNQREQLNETANLAELSAQLETATLTFEAQKNLVKQGIVSKLDFQQTMLEKKQLTKRIEIFTLRQEQLTQVHEESMNIQRERIKQQEGQVNIAQSRLNKLTVIAGFNGVVQRLSVELGENISAGQEIALIGSVTDLIALINVPQNQVQQIQIGQKTTIDTRRDTIIGSVARIDPVVFENTVEVEITLPKTLPNSARPQSSVDGVITTANLNNITYIKRPAGVRDNSDFTLYKVHATDSTATLHQVRFGQKTNDFIEIESGAELGDHFIISDLRHIQNTHEKIVIE